jgi:DNA-binding transcriptional MerR regulator
MHSREAIQSISWRARAWEAGRTLSEGAMAQRELDVFDALEAEHPQGISASQIVEFFAPRGVKLAQATFRKYVQLGLLPRSRRVGEKGKHRGSKGLYPASAARRIHVIKSLMDEGMTLEDIRHSFIFFRGQLDGVERSLDELFAALEKAIAEKPELRPSRRKELERLLAESRKQANQFVKDMERTVSEITAREEPGKG